MVKLHFGIGGFPHTTKNKNVITAMARVKELGLDAMELEFTYGAWLKEEDAPKVNKERKKLEIELTVHGPYYVNLAAETRPKQHASISYIEKAARVGDMAGAYSVTFHPAAYMKRPAETVFQIVKGNLKEIVRTQEKEKRPIHISPELTGKPTFLGDLNDLIRLSKEIQGLYFCVDFSHNHARSNGKYNSYDDFCKMFDDIASGLGEKYLKEMHMHVSGIEYSEKGERNHINFLMSKKKYEEAGVIIEGWESVKGIDHRYVQNGADFKWMDLMKALKKCNVAGVLTCESPNLEQDALLMKQYYMSI